MMLAISRTALCCLAAVAVPLTTFEGVLASDDPVARTTLSVCNLGGGPDNDGTTVTGFPGTGYDEYEVLLDRVALPTGRTLQASPPGKDDPAEPLFAKAGLLVKPRKPFTLVVPRPWRRHLSIAWGGARRTLRLRVDLACGPVPAGTWVAYPGGFWVDEAACVPLLVKTAHTTKRVQLGIGEACRSGG